MRTLFLRIQIDHEHMGLLNQTQKQKKKCFAMATVFCIVIIFFVAMCHLYYRALQIHMGPSSINYGIALGTGAGLLTAGICTLLKHPLWGLFLGAVICYFLAVVIIVVSRGIPMEWIY